MLKVQSSWPYRNYETEEAKVLREDNPERIILTAGDFLVAAQDICKLRCKNIPLKRTKFGSAALIIMAIEDMLYVN